MGKVARAAAAVAAPESVAARQITPGMPPAQVRDELQQRRQAAAAAKTAKASTPAPKPAPAAPTAATSPPPASPGGGLSLPTAPAPVQAAASTGSGFLLGVFAWAIGLAYLRGGTAGVKQFMAAKFLNKTT